MDRSTVRRRIDESLIRFAGRLRDQIGATRVLLFGSYARGTASPDSDYDLIIVSPCFAKNRPMERSLGLRELFYEVGGNAPMDLICLTPEEFEAAKQSISLIAAVLPEAIDVPPAPSEQSACPDMGGVSPYDAIADWCNSWVGPDALDLDAFFPAVRGCMGDIAGQEGSPTSRLTRRAPTRLPTAPSTASSVTWISWIFQISLRPSRESTGFFAPGAGLSSRFCIPATTVHRPANCWSMGECCDW